MVVREAININHCEAEICSDKYIKKLHLLLSIQFKVTATDSKPLLSLYLKTSWVARGIIPSSDSSSVENAKFPSNCGPNIVYVFPLPVCP